MIIFEAHNGTVSEFERGPRPLAGAFFYFLASLQNSWGFAQTPGLPPPVGFAPEPLTVFPGPVADAPL